MKTTIKLNSRDGTDNKLVQKDNTKFQLVAPYGYKVGYKARGECAFIDPSGGPIIYLGSTIEGYTVKSITEDGIIEFES